jgi:CheY-like chemotaxis protein
MMPEMSGLETLQAMKENASMRATPVIMLSASDASDIMVRCILSGAEDYIAKPFNPILLLARINAALEKIRLRRNAARQIKVFISSPGDVIPERQVAKMVLGRLNDEFSGRALLIPILWEDEPLLVTETFQAQIHPPREADIYLGILWSRIGSPLPPSITREDGSIYESGTVFEFEDALAGHQATGKPEMLLYLKSGFPDISLEDREAVLGRLDQIDLLNMYRERMLMGKDGTYAAAFHMFETMEQFEIMLDMHLRKLVASILARR